MVQHSKESTSLDEIIYDPAGAKKTLEEFAAEHRRSIAFLIKAAHNLGIPYVTALKLHVNECKWVSHKSCYDVMILDSKTRCINAIIQDVSPQRLYPLYRWWLMKRRPGSIEVVNFLRVCLDILGIAIDAETKLPAGFYLDAPAIGAKDSSVWAKTS